MTVENARVGAIMIDCHDPDALLEFWSQIVGIEAAQRFPNYIDKKTLTASANKLNLC